MDRNVIGEDVDEKKLQVGEQDGKGVAEDDEKERREDAASENGWGKKTGRWNQAKDGEK
jgi:hypothetical protein